MIGRPSGLRHLLIVALGLTVISILGASAEHAPDAVVERVHVTGTRKTRVCLFNNYMAVLRITENGKETLSSQLLLDYEEYVVYVGAIDRDGETIAGMSFIPSTFEDSPPTILRMNIGGRGLIEVRFPMSAHTELPVARLSAALDDLEARIATASNFSDELHDWEPKRGDVVELITGGRARVSEVLPEGLLKIEHLDLAILEYVPIESRTKVIRRVLETGR